MSTQCQPPWLGSSLSSETQKPCSARCGPRCCTSTFTVSPTIQWGNEGTEQSPNPQMLLDHTSQGDTTSPKRKGPWSSPCCVFDPAQGFPQCPGPGWQLHLHFLPLCKSWEALIPSGPDSSLGVGKSTVLSPQVVRIDSHGLRARLGRALWGELSKRVLTRACRWSTVSNTPAGSPLCGHVVLL